MMRNGRIKIQEGAFILFGINGNRETPPDFKHHIFEETRRVRFLIKEKDKPKLLKELQLLGIHKGNLFPEIENYNNFIKDRIQNEIFEQNINHDSNDLER